MRLKIKILVFFLLNVFLVKIHAQTPTCPIDVFAEELSKNPALKNLSVGQFKAFEFLINNPQLRKDISVLTSLGKALDDDWLKTLDLNDIIQNKWIGKGHFGCPTCTSGGEPFINEILDDLLAFKSYKDMKGANYLINNLTSDVPAQVIGANWTAKFLKNNPSMSSKKLVFEEFESTDLGGRFTDVKDITDATNIIYYEFKSVVSLPPSDFQRQFMKDLGLATKLENVRWVFDKAKNPLGAGGKSFEETLKDEINKLPLTDELAKKIIPNNPLAKADDLKELLEIRFVEIFKLEN